MSNRKISFRKEAIKAQESQWLGKVILSRPASFKTLTIAFSSISIAIVCFVIFGKFTQRATVHGQLLPKEGLIYIYPKNNGNVEKKFIVEDMAVNKGDQLFTVSTLNFYSNEDKNHSLLKQIELRKLLNNEEKNKLNSNLENDILLTKNDISSIKNQLLKIENNIKEQRDRVYLAKENYERYQNLFKKDYISKEEFQSKKDIFLQMQQNLKNFESELISKNMELNNKISTLRTIHLNYENNLINIDKQLTNIEQEIIDNQSQREFTIKATADGAITSVTTEVGQQVTTNKPVVAIIPKDSILEAILYVPPQNIGFIKTNQIVKLRYDAFPYQKFGQAIGRVSSISKSTMNINELPNSNQINLEKLKTANVYIVKVEIQNQSMSTYATKTPLKVGMTLDADIFLETRNIYEWIFLPLLSIYEKNI
ncbi:HlyD family efflux transporter periplasmic adaptor subunit [Acinetobacter calcoaceticus]|uniref:HlyD family secretion protein n=1 Tax=Acinetobacter calcoaceticus TaxID=471 RepID=UPI002866BD08|nr:HlyD family efflux transporter periplasmic adaptor subunit [Acinetobacter calcoaceticus]MDR6798329.1 membrane fusion protein [Acinetobacter calcoaceticus]